MKNHLISILFISLLSGCGGGGGDPSNSSLDTETTNTNQSSKNISPQNIHNQENRSFKQTIKTQGSAKSVVVHDETMFVAEGKNGVEIMKIGFSDTISSELLYKIKDIDARKVTLSKDGKTLLIEKADTKVVLVDIRNLTSPKIVGEKPKIQIQNDVTNKNNTYKYVARGKDGMQIWNISNPSNPQLISTMKSSNCFDIVLIDDDTKALIATGAVGIKLIKLDNPKVPNPVATYRIPGASAEGLTLNKTKDALFVATGKNGVMVFNLDMLLEKMGY